MLFFVVAELKKMLFVVSEAFPRCGLGPLQSELCVCEQRAHSDQPGSHPARTQQHQDRFSSLTACLWRHSSDNLSQERRVVISAQEMWGAGALPSVCPVKTFTDPRAGKEPLPH